MKEFLQLPIMTFDELSRFWKYVYKTNYCWAWLGSTDSSNRGNLKINGKMLIASRLSYFIHYKKDPGKFLVCHECNNTNCVNPDHFYLGTYGDNNKQAFIDGLNTCIGEWNSRAKLSLKEVLEIRSLQGSCTQIELAAKYNVSSGHINNILQRRSWSHI